MSDVWQALRSEEAACGLFEATIWPAGIRCPHCGEVGRNGPLRGLSTRAGLRKCYACQHPFTAKGATLLRASHLPLHLWLRILWLSMAGTRAPTVRELASSTGISMKTAAKLRRWLEGLGFSPGCDHPDPTRLAEALALLAPLQTTSRAGVFMSPREQAWINFLRISVELGCIASREAFLRRVQTAFCNRVASHPETAPARSPVTA